MEEKPSKKSQTFWLAALALALWLITFALGLQAIYSSLQIFYMIFGSLGGNLMRSDPYAMALILVFGIAYTVFVIGSAEYHRKRVGTQASWRVFLWTIAVEVSIILLAYILYL